MVEAGVISWQKQRFETGSLFSDFDSLGGTPSPMATNIKKEFNYIRGRFAQTFSMIELSTPYAGPGSGKLARRRRYKLGRVFLESRSWNAF
ncbi:hypothetical protein SAMN05192553_10350 [Cyclobacterium xiamenense]|uniref:Uncharacterized protein n=1 Tax=Cyclobacterium xiamenense TaxID=1297121 RepID=A0A1H6XN21_9BACT|nr:hypothetical protein SAMN05192553_10350 [Cyclobacterium xiamenense]